MDLGLCKADCGLCCGAVLNSHKSVQCDNCEMLVHNECSYITETQSETMQNSNVLGFSQNATSSIFPILSLMTS